VNVDGASPPLAGVDVLVFDVFGTVVDWRTSVLAALDAFGRERGVEHDWAGFADRWRSGYITGILRVNAGEEPWQSVDEIHRASLVSLLAEAGVTGVGEADLDALNRVWHRLDPWPDAVRGLARLRERFVVATLSNGNLALLVGLARHGGLGWDCVLSADFVRRFKPDPEVYRFAARALEREPARLAMVAAHPPDLEAARGAGLATIYVDRPNEWGPERAPVYRLAGDEFDVHARDLEDLADRIVGG
jgi:2-haloacid dehalogenase